MKRRLILALLALLCSPVWAQNVMPDSSAADTSALGDTPRQRKQKVRNVLGAPVYYDTLGNVLGAAGPQDSFYHRPKHHFLNRLEYDFNSLFFEMETMFGGRDAALGMQLTWLPQRWGGYFEVSRGLRSYYFSAGPSLRLSDCGNIIDWHLYTGVVVGRGVGVEGGIRMAAPRNFTGFCWTSFTMGGGYVDRQGFFTLGFSIALVPEAFLFMWF